MLKNVSYKSFCWSLGTTSFRTKKFNKMIEEQLSLLAEFWTIEVYDTQKWVGNSLLQSKYYDFMKSRNFVDGNAENKPKDAREKTSGLVDLGLINENRKLTGVGLSLLKISRGNDFSSDNLLQIPKDSYIYLKQLLKTYNNLNGKYVRPFIVLLYVLSKLDYLTTEEYTFLLPLCTDCDNTQYIIKKINSLRTNKNSIDDIIIDRLMSMDNYQAGLKILLENKVTETIICTVGFNRKSRSYDMPYYFLYNHLYEVFVNKNFMATKLVYKATKNIKIGNLWRNYLFDTISEKAIYNAPSQHLNNTIFSSVTTKAQFKVAFYKIMHLFKAKSTLLDYFDLNKRYIKTADVILFEDDTIKADIVPKHFFNSVIDELYKSAFIPSGKLFIDCKLEDISACLVINKNIILDGINKELNTNIDSIEESYAILEKNRYNRLQHLIDTKFSDDKLLLLLDLFETRNDVEISRMVTDNADIPTIFEYVLGILWYKVSCREGKILDYMKLSLDSDLLPKTHAVGGEADIVYEYEETKNYPKHTLLLEATLADRTNQRRMEMEPVSRHLGQHLLKTTNINSYCLFVTNFLNINVIADFRGRKAMPYYDPKDYENYVDGMKIIPLQTQELKNIISKGKEYKNLYSVFETAYISELPAPQWYDKYIKKGI